MNGIKRVIIFCFLIPIVSFGTTTKFLSPINDSIIIGNMVPIVLKGCKYIPKTFAHLGKSKMNLRWEKSLYKKRWIARLLLKNHDSNILTIDGKCGRKKIFYSVKLNWHEDSKSVGDQVINHFIAQNSAHKQKWDWGPAVFLYGMTKNIQFSSNSKKLIQYIENYHEYWSLKGLPKIDWADKCPSALSAFYLAKNNDNYNYWPSIEKVIRWIKNAKRNDLKSLNHFGNKTWMTKLFPASIWVDSLVMWNILALKYALYNQDEDLKEFALKQPLIFEQNLKDPETGLFYHAWNIAKGRPFPKRNTFWLRGNGWVLTALIDMLELINKDNKYYAKLKNIFIDLAKSINRYRLKSNYWDTLLAFPGDGYEESSGSALIAYAYLKGYRMGFLPRSYQSRGIETYSSIVARMPKTRQGGSMTDISWLTMPYGKFGYKMLMRQSDVSYGVGAFLLLNSEMGLLN